MRLVYYSLANVSDDSRERQWIQSIRSLRAHNRTVPVSLLLFNGASEQLLHEAQRHKVCVHSIGDYRSFLGQAHPRGAVLSLYPTFHKFLALTELPLKDVTQLLYLDCDTFFFQDVNLLFDAHAKHDWYSREEPASMRSPFGYDPQHIDEILLEYIARSENLRYVPPFNSGVCLLNRGIWNEIGRLRNSYLNYAWRLLCGRELSGHDYGVHDSKIHSAAIEVMTDADRYQALPFPSKNGWIIEQIALWLTLGKLEDFSLGTFSQTHVAQGGELEGAKAEPGQCVLAHYFSGGEQEFFSVVPPIAA